MQISCAICRELIVATQTAMVTNCGHCYHQECILRWAENRPSCPQCRVSLIHRPIRVFFNLEDDANANSAELLQLKVTQWRSQFDDLQNRFLEVKNQLDPLQTDNKTYQERIVALEKKLVAKDNVIESSRAKIVFLLSENKQLQDVAGKLDKANKDLHLLRSVHNILYGTQQDVEKAVESMACNPQSIRQLSTYVEVLKLQSEKNSLRYKRLLKNHKTLMAEKDKNDKRLEEELRVALQSLKELKENRSVDNHIVEQPDEQQSLEPIVENTTTFKSLNDTAAEVVMKSLSKDLSLKVIDNLKIKRLDVAPIPRLRMLPSKMLLACQSRASPVPPSRTHFGYDGMGGSKRISLATPTPPEELARLRKRVQDKLRSKSGYRAPNLTARTNPRAGKRAPDTTSANAMDTSVNFIDFDLTAPTNPRAENHAPDTTSASAMDTFVNLIELD